MKFYFLKNRIFNTYRIKGNKINLNKTFIIIFYFKYKSIANSFINFNNVLER